MKQQTQKKQVTNEAAAIPATFQTSQDLRTAVLIVSVLANVALFVAWLTLKLAPQYTATVTGIFFG
jgi:hypothetical protein